MTGGVPERTVIAHLSAGASLCGLRAGRSVATTMGFTPLDGLVMATRSGSIDPGAVLHLVLRGGIAAKLAWLGLQLGDEANAAQGPRISTAASRVAAWVIPTDEEGVIAAHAAATASRR